MKLSVIVPSKTGEMPRGLKEDPRIELVIVKGVCPVGRARNEGLGRATGDYIAWVDADDEVKDDWFDEIWAALKSRPDVVVLGHEWVMPNGFFFTRIWKGTDLLGDVLAQRGLRSEMWNYVIRRALWKGIQFNDSSRTHEDWEIVPRLLMQARTVVPLGKAVYCYRANPASLTHQHEDLSMQREAYDRSVARIDEIRSLGLWQRHGLDTLIGIANTIYLNPYAGPWFRRQLVKLLTSTASFRQKAIWILSALGLRNVIEWRYGR